MEKSRFEVFLSCYLTDAQVGLLKEALATGKGVHFYGPQGQGKSTLCTLFHRAGYQRVTEAGTIEGTEMWLGPYAIPDVDARKGVVLLEVRMDYTEKGRSEISAYFEKPFTKDEVTAWVLS